MAIAIPAPQLVARFGILLALLLVLSTTATVFRTPKAVRADNSSALGDKVSALAKDKAKWLSNVSDATSTVETETDNLAAAENRLHTQVYVLAVLHDQIDHGLESSYYLHKQLTERVQVINSITDHLEKLLQASHSHAIGPRGADSIPVKHELAKLKAVLSALINLQDAETQKLATLQVNLPAWQKALVTQQAALPALQQQASGAAGFMGSARNTQLEAWNTLQEIQRSVPALFDEVDKAYQDKLDQLKAAQATPPPAPTPVPVSPAPAGKGSKSSHTGSIPQPPPEPTPTPTPVPLPDRDTLLGQMGISTTDLDFLSKPVGSLGLPFGTLNYDSPLGPNDVSRSSLEKSNILVGVSTWMWPLGGVITTTYGDSTPFQGFHSGIDIAPRVMYVPVHAAASGVVIHAGLDNPNTRIGGYGNVVIIRHNPHLVSLYGHLDDRVYGLRVSVGDQVVVGQVIGFIGLSGWTTGAHLHFELRLDNHPFDPMAVIPGTPEKPQDTALHYYLPILARGDNNLSSYFTVKNPGLSTVNYRVTYYHQDGSEAFSRYQSLTPHSTHYWDQSVELSLAHRQLYTAEVLADSQLTVSAGLQLIYTRKELGPDKPLGNPDAPPVTAQTYTGVFKGEKTLTVPFIPLEMGVNAGVLVQNTSTDEANLILTYVTSNGQKVEGSHSTLPGKGSATLPLAPPPAAKNVTSVQLTSTTAVGAVLTTSRDDTMLSASAVTAPANTTSATFASNDTNYSFYVNNTTAQGATVTVTIKTKQDRVVLIKQLDPIGAHRQLSWQLTSQDLQVAAKETKVPNITSIPLTLTFTSTAALQVGYQHGSESGLLQPSAPIAASGRGSTAISAKQSTPTPIIEAAQPPPVVPLLPQ